MRDKSSRDGARAPIHVDFHLLDAHHPELRGGTGDTFDWDLIGKRREGPGRPLRRADAGQRGRGDRGDAPVRGRHARAGPRPSPGARTRPSSRRSSARSRRRTSCAARGMRVSTAGCRAALRPLRRPLRPRDARARARRARGARGSPRATTRRSSSELDGLLRDYVGRPSPLYLAKGISERVGPRRLAEARGPATTPARTRSTTRSARRCSRSGWASRASSRRPARASTASPRRPRARCSTSTASSTWAPRTCAASGPTSSGCGCSAPQVVGVEAGARTLKEAVSEAIRDWVANSATTHYIIGSAVGPVALPVARPRPPARDRRRGARPGARGRPGALPARVTACVGGGSNAIGTFTAFVDDDDVELVGVEAAGEGLDTDRHGASLTAGATRRAARRDVGGAPGRGGPDHRGALGLRRARLPGLGARARPAARQRAACASWRSPTTQALRAFRETCRLEGIIPALESAHAIAWLFDEGAGDGAPGYDLLTLSGRGDKDLAEVLGLDE